MALKIIDRQFTDTSDDEETVLLHMLEHPYIIRVFQVRRSVIESLLTN